MMTELNLEKAREDICILSVLRDFGPFCFSHSIMTDMKKHQTLKFKSIYFKNNKLLGFKNCTLYKSKQNLKVKALQKDKKPNFLNSFR